MKKYILIYGVLMAFAVLHTAYYYGLLPGVMASKFDFSGNVSGMMAKDLFFAIYLFVMALLNVAFLVSSALIAKLPDRMINIPNKDYWLSEERREKTKAEMRNHMLQFGMVSQIFVIAVIHAALEANLHPQDPTASSWTLLPMIVGFTVYVIGWSAYLVLRYLKIPQTVL